MVFINKSKGIPTKWWVWLIGIGLPIFMLATIPFAGFLSGNKWDQQNLKRTALMEQTGMTAKELANYLQAEKLKEMEGSARMNAASRMGGGFGNMNNNSNAQGGGGGGGFSFGGVQIPISSITNLFKK